MLLCSSDWQGEHPSAELIDEATAAGWFAACGLPLPAELEGVIV